MLLFCASSFIFAQFDSTTTATEEVIEETLIEQDEESDNEELVDIFEDLLQNPIDINSADVYELTKLPDIDNKIAQQIIDHRNKFGYFFSPSELLSIREIDKKVIENILPFIKSTLPKEEISSNDIDIYEDNVSFLTKAKVNFRSRVTNDLQSRKGFTTEKYVGSEIKSYNRLLISYDKNYQAGILIEKDPGEKSFNDFTSFHLQVKDLSVFKNLIAGDYVLEFGQGLALWSAYGLSKGSDAIFPVKKKARNQKAYTSAAEYRFFRGIVNSFNVDDFVLTGFYSNRAIDASIDTLTNEITASGQTGFHRFESELVKKKSVNEKIFGGVLDYKLDNTLKAGIIYYQASYSNSFQSTSLYALKGDKFNYLSTYYDLNVSGINLFGEASFNGTSVASINGIQISATPKLNFTSSVRSYPRNYNNLFGFGFGESSGRTKNEIGFYNGLKWKTSFGVVNLYYDIFKFPFSTSSNTLPSQGDELLFDYLTTPFAKFDFRIRYKYENKDVTEEINSDDQIVKRLRQSIRTEFVYSLSKSIRLKTRLEYNHYLISDAKVKEKGILLFQDVRVAASKNINLYARIIFFQTDSFSSAVYEFENDLLGVMPNLAMYGKGIRWYFIAKYKPLKFLSLSAKYSETYKPDETSLSSGDNEIIGNLDNRFSLQIDLSF